MLLYMPEVPVGACPAEARLWLKNNAPIVEHIEGSIPMDVILTDLKYTVIAGVVLTVIVILIAPLIAG